MKKAHIKGALVGVEAVTEEGLKAVFKDFNCSGDTLVSRLKTFRKHDVHVLGSFIFGLPTDREDTFRATAELAKKSDLTFAQFVVLTPFPGTVDFKKWEAELGDGAEIVHGVPVTRYWQLPSNIRPKRYSPHPTMTVEEIRANTQKVWDSFYEFKAIWKRSNCVKSLKARLAFVLISKLYRQMYANTGITTDSARRRSATQWSRWIAKPCLKLFRTTPMPELAMPVPAPQAFPIVGD